MANNQHTPEMSALNSQQFSRGIENFEEIQFEPLQVVKRVFSTYVMPYWKRLSFSLLASLFLAGTTAALPFLLQRIVDDVLIGKDVTLLYWLSLAVFFLMLIRAALQYAAKITMARISNEVTGALRVDMYNSLTKADLSFLDGTNSGRYVSSFMTDVNMVNAAAAGTITSLAKYGLTAVALVISMFFLDPILASLVLFGLPFGIFFMNRQKKKIRGSVKGALAETGGMSSLIGQMLKSVRVVKAFGQEETEQNRFKASIRRLISHSMRQARAQSILAPATEALGGIGLAAAIFYGGLRGINGSLTTGEFSGFMAAAMLIFQPLRSLSDLQGMLTQGATAAARVFKLIDHQPAVTDNKDAQKLKDVAGEITFTDINFTYDGTTPVLTDFSLNIPAGSKVALVGPSGSGKTTLMNMILRFFDPISGQVFIDGQPIQDRELQSVRQASALLTQDPILFDDTVYGNICYGIATATEDEVHAAARAAAAHDFILDLPKGYQTDVGEAGALLSGGQRQRIAVARAILKGAPILLLDEPTSALDADSERSIQLALDTLLKGRTVVMIAHRLSTVKEADIICVLSEGRLVEQGTHEELMANDRLYAQYSRTQLNAD